MSEAIEPQPTHHRATQSEKLVITASSLGTVFEWYDFYLYGLLATTISTQFFSGVNETTGFILALAAFAAGFAVRPFGALVFGRIGDLVGRKNIYRIYLGVGALMYLVIALAGNVSTALFVVCAMVILSFYGGGFATIPAYLKDLFGTYQVGAIHGRLLTAWSTAGVLGPLIVNAIADGQKAAGKSGPDLYTNSLYIMIALLVVGLVANELVKPVAARFHEAAELEEASR